MTAIVGASPEVIEHHIGLHPCHSTETRIAICPCGRALAIICDECDEPMFGVAGPGDAACEHLAELLGMEAVR